MNLNKKRQKLVRKLTNKEYRDAWVNESIKTVLPYQIQAIRKQKGWSQALLGEKAGMLPNAVTRLESIDYGNLSVNTLLRIAHGFDCGLLVKFVPFNRLVREFEDVSTEALEVDSFEDDIVFNSNQAAVENESTIPIEAKFPSEYAIGIVKELTFTLSSKSELLTEYNANGQGFDGVAFSEEPYSNATEFATV